MPKGYVEVSIRSVVDAGELLGMLQSADALGCSEENGIIRIYWPEEKWAPQILEDLKKSLSCLGTEDSVSSAVIRVIPDMDWNATWAASLVPIRIGKRVRIRQSWHSEERDLNDIELVIDPKRAFGTGHHATTQLAIEWLEKRIRGEERLLDIGTGSGILAMVALRLGAKSALAIDSDPATVECAREYAAVNGFGRELEIQTVSFRNFDAGRFDVIVANLSGKAMPELCEILPGMLNSDGAACLSGLQAQDYDEIASTLRHWNLQISARMQRGEWLALEVAQKAH